MFLGRTLLTGKRAIEYNTIQYNTICFILRQIPKIVNISSFELFTDNKYDTIIIQIYIIGMQHYNNTHVCIM